MGWRDVPALFRHMTLAVYKKSTSGMPDGFVEALKITRAKLAEWGYIYHGGHPNAPLDKIFLTGKGWKRNLQHERESFMGDLKDLEFERLYKEIEPRIYELDGPGGRQPPEAPKNAEDQQDAEKVDIRTDASPGPLYPPPQKR